MRAFSSALDNLIDSGAPVTPEVAEALRSHWLSGNLFYFDHWNRWDTSAEVDTAAKAQAILEINKLRAAQISIAPEAATVLERWFVSGAIWAFDNRFLERERRIITRH